jgi:hypothetical protein
MLMTVRINRAKGGHSAVKMRELIRQLVGDFTYDHQRIAQGIGAHKGEVELLYSEGVFAAKKNGGAPVQQSVEATANVAKSW